MNFSLKGSEGESILQKTA